MRWEVPGVVELAGAVEVHREGLRAERARPYALFVLPNANAARAERLAAAHRAQLVPVRGADDAAAWCRERGLGLSPADVERLLGPEALAEERARAAPAAARRRAQARGGHGGRGGGDRGRGAGVRPAGSPGVRAQRLGRSAVGALRDELQRRH